MPYGLLHTADGYYVITKTTGKRHSQRPLSKAKAEAQLRVLMSQDDPPEQWIQAVTSSPDFHRGAFTKEAALHDKKPLEFMKIVLASPENYSITTRRRAQFLKNIQSD